MGFHLELWWPSVSTQTLALSLQPLVERTHNREGYEKTSWTFHGCSKLENLMQKRSKFNIETISNYRYHAVQDKHAACIIWVSTVHVAHSSGGWFQQQGWSLMSIHSTSRRHRLAQWHCQNAARSSQVQRYFYTAIVSHCDILQLVDNYYQLAIGYIPQNQGLLYTAGHIPAVVSCHC